MAVDRTNSRRLPIRQGLVGGLAWGLCLLIAVGCGGRNVKQPPDSANVAIGRTQTPGATPQATPASAEASDLVGRGEELFRARGCPTCHQQNVRSPIGADLAGLAGSSVKLADGTTVQADAAYLRESILKPAARVVAGFNAVMPPYEGQLTPEELDALVAYIQSLAKSGGASPNP